MNPLDFSRLCIRTITLMAALSSIQFSNAVLAQEEARILVIYTEDARQAVEESANFSGWQNDPVIYANSLINELNDHLDINEFENVVEYVLASTAANASGVISSGFIYDENDGVSPPYDPPDDGPYDPGVLGNLSGTSGSLSEMAHDLHAGRSSIIRHDGRTLDQLRTIYAADRILLLGNEIGSIQQLGGASASGDYAGIDDYMIVATVHDLRVFAAVVSSHEMAHTLGTTHAMGECCEQIPDPVTGEPALRGTTMTAGHQCGPQFTCRNISQRFGQAALDKLDEKMPGLADSFEVWQAAGHDPHSGNYSGPGGPSYWIEYPDSPDLEVEMLVCYFHPDFGSIAQFHVTAQPVSGATRYVLATLGGFQTIQPSEMPLDYETWAIEEYGMSSVSMLACNDSVCSAPDIAWLSVPPCGGFPW